MASAPLRPRPFYSEPGERPTEHVHRSHAGDAFGYLIAFVKKMVPRRERPIDEELEARIRVARDMQRALREQFDAMNRAVLFVPPQPRSYKDMEETPYTEVHPPALPAHRENEHDE